MARSDLVVVQLLQGISPAGGDRLDCVDSGVFRRRLGRAPDADDRWITLGVLLFAAGFLFEAVGDEQLRRFRNEPRNVKLVLETGLWRYTRHPNYFGEALVWWGLGLIGAATGGVVGLIVPALMTHFLRNISGPLLERSLLRNRRAYANYVAETSAFIPNFRGDEAVEQAKAKLQKPPNPRRLGGAIAGACCRCSWFCSSAPAYAR